ncbi:MAG: aldehyde dehydrogenase family protein, partial [Variovorax sp.]
MTAEIDYANATHPFLDGAPKRMLIGGQWVAAASGKTFETRNPATGELLAVVPEGDREDIDRAVAAARTAFDGPWRRMKPDERAALMHALADLVDAHYDELAWLDTLDMGSPIRHTRGSRRHLVGLMRYFAGQATAIHGLTAETSLNGDMFAATLKEPVGVVGAIIPWNGPLWATVFKTAPVLATGCTLVLKPAEDAPLTPLRFAELALQAGVPPGVINVVTGFGAGAGAA